MFEHPIQHAELGRFVFDRTALARLPLKDKQLIERFGQGPRIALPYTCIHHAFEAQALRRPGAIAARHAGEAVSYGELDQQAAQVAAVLAQHGVTAGDHVALFMQRSLPMLAGILGVLKLGAAYVPQDARIAPRPQLEYIIKAAATKVILTLSSLRHLVPVPEGTVCLNLDEILFAKSDNVLPITKPQLRGDESCFVLFTSGTTGMPNGVKVTHRNVCNILLTSPGNLGIQPGMTVSQILNISFDMAAWEIFGALAHGATLIIRGKEIAEAVKQSDVVIATPSILGALDADSCRNVKVAAVAGEPCPRPLADKWSSFCTFYNSCGPTEVTIVNTMQSYSSASERLTIGRPTPNNTVYILDENMNPCPVGEIGEMWAGGDCVSSGYIGNEDLTAERYRPDPFLGQGRMMFRTRDLGRWTPEGELEHFGRTDDQVKIRGFRVELDSVSAALEKVEGCTHAVTLKLDSRTLVSFVTPAKVDTSAAKKAVADSLPYYCTPELIFALDELPMTDRGKVDKRALTRYAVQEQERKRPEKESLPAKNLYHAVARHPLLMPYNRWAVLALTINVLLYGWLQPSGVDLLANLVLGNFAVALLIRQQYVINGLFAAATSVPHSWPLRLRWAAGKVYHFGGIHVGAFFSGALWFTLLTAEFARLGSPLTALSVFHLGLLIVMMIMALPKIRARHHNAFEIVARFGGWTSLLLFWVQTVALANAPLVTMPQFWVLSLVTFSVALPWLRLKKVAVDLTTPSSHVALARFDYGVTPFAGSSTDLSRNPLLEWHSFANVPAPGKPGFRLTISRAGDWTGSLIDQKPSHLWVKGIPTAGVGNIETLFKRVVWVATGSGIGPCLPHLLANNVPSLLVWSTRNPRKTYGDELVDEILAVQPNAVIWDTEKDGKPDLAQLAYHAWKTFEAEAVICISNKKVTWHVVYEMESRGIPAFGAIWDS